MSSGRGGTQRSTRGRRATPVGWEPTRLEPEDLAQACPGSPPRYGCRAWVSSPVLSPSEPRALAPSSVSTPMPHTARASRPAPRSCYYARARAARRARPISRARCVADGSLTLPGGEEGTSFAQPTLRVVQAQGRWSVELSLTGAARRRDDGRVVQAVPLMVIVTSPASCSLGCGV